MAGILAPGRVVAIQAADVADIAGLLIDKSRLPFIRKSRVRRDFPISVDEPRAAVVGTVPGIRPRFIPALPGVAPHRGFPELGHLPRMALSARFFENGVIEGERPGVLVMEQQIGRKDRQEVSFPRLQGRGAIGVQPVSCCGFELPGLHGEETKEPLVRLDLLRGGGVAEVAVRARGGHPGLGLRLLPRDRKLGEPQFLHSGRIPVAQETAVSHGAGLSGKGHFTGKDEDPP
jgi:hypothetical protein